MEPQVIQSIYSGSNPEIIGILGLTVTVFALGMEQLGIGLKNADPVGVTKTLSLVAILYGGVAQLFAAASIYLGNILGHAPTSMFLGTIFMTFGLFWVVVGLFFRFGGEKKQLANFFLLHLFIICAFQYVAIHRGLDSLVLCLWPIIGLLIVLPFLYNGIAVKPLTKLAGVLNILIGLTALPLLWHQLQAALAIPQ